ncbi:MAG: hypothetical protein AB8B93_11295 [Pseudomonadales bacterium]
MLRSPLSVTLATIALVLAAPLAVPANAAKAAKDPALERASKREGLECRRVKETGSRTSRKVCTTRAQRESRARRAQDDLERVQRNADLSPAAN